jgi:G3E family GTPase
MEKNMLYLNVKFVFAMEGAAMTKIDIFSGFLGAGKTTLIKKLIAEAYQGEKVMLIENEFGEIGIDGGFMKEAGVEITEMNSGCICCSLVGDFAAALKQVLQDYAPDRILIEPSGVGKLSDVILAVQGAVRDDVMMGSYVTVADASKVKMYMKNFGEFYNNQIEHASTIVLSRTQNLNEEKLQTCLTLLREKNQNAIVVTTPWDQVTGRQILDAMEKARTLQTELEALEEETCCCHDHDHDHHHHDHDHDHDHDHEHHHDHDHHHEHECDHDHEHHHDHDEACCCGHDHEHHHHHDHDADEVFTSWGVETAKKFTQAQLHDALAALDSGKCGTVLRAKGIVAGEDGSWIHFDFVPGEQNLRTGPADVTGRLCVIGSELDEAAIAAQFGV